MSIFSIFKRRKIETPDMTPAAILSLTQEYVPEFYRDSKHYKDSKEFLENNEWGLALESLIEMADESGHYFSEDFWLDLATCADKMQMTEQGNYCKQQIIRNEKELGDRTPKGWATIKVYDTTREHHIAQIVEDKGRRERHKKDELNELLNTNGFHIKYYGRSGTIYYIENGKVLEIGFEISAVPQYDMLLYFDQLIGWTIPKDEPFALTEQAEIREKLKDWLKSKNIKSDLK